MKKQLATWMIFSILSYAYAYVFGPVIDKKIINQQQYNYFTKCHADGLRIRDTLEANGTVWGAAPTPLTAEDVIFLLYTRKNVHTPQILLVGDSNETVSSTNIDFSKQTILYVSGLHESYLNAAMLFTSTLLPREDVNIIITNWDSYAFYSFAYSRFFTTARLGTVVGDFLQTLINAGADPKKIHLIGFSTGGQVVGLAGKMIRPKVAKITVYDAQGSCFNFLPPTERLNQTDADQVEIIHCTVGQHGIPLNITGDVTFYMNGGLIQPQCANLMTIELLNACSHMMCGFYLYQSLQKSSPLIGVKCDSYSSYLQNQCDCSDRVTLTYNVSSSVKGPYFIDTPPFKMMCNF